MNLLIYLFASGAAFFVGCGAVLVSLAIFAARRNAASRIVGTLIAILGFAFIALSATPLPYGFYGVAGAASASWLIAERVDCHSLCRARHCLRILVALLWLAGIVIEAPFHRWPTIPSAPGSKLVVIGDSLSAGLDERDGDIWPSQLAKDHAVEVVNLARVGATAGSARHQVEKLDSGPAIIILEIGGNDLLGSTSAADFHRDLDQLLALVCSEGRAVVMFELPLPPLANEFGRVQRTLAANYHVPLIPKRVLASAITMAGGTSDSLHLTAAGHRQIAEAVWRVVSSGTTRFASTRIRNVECCGDPQAVISSGARNLLSQANGSPDFSLRSK